MYNKLQKVSYSKSADIITHILNTAQVHPLKAKNLFIQHFKFDIPLISYPKFAFLDIQIDLLSFYLHFIWDNRPYNTDILCTVLADQVLSNGKYSTFALSKYSYIKSYSDIHSYTKLTDKELINIQHLDTTHITYFKLKYSFSKSS